ncbi:hypothetical protein [Ancylomarina sp. 16SWW S1-10-2]|uniref:hypothetical protein n=1 Tax=Ancylomarina sp. 16SWW S1-10-2 TaxID=2499681 RepID=UPI0012AE0A17|nr:hypothetical protein [Ancylomarina sp. 16SWW S1-10-2]MRT91384.1 hypothetical protein [Ancylomarina sp. 16SWW S1-10-2]
MKEVQDESKIEKLLKMPSHGYTSNFHKREMWKEIAKSFNGEFKIKFDSSKTYEMHYITIPHKKWEISITVSDTRPLKFQVFFSSRMEFDIELSLSDFIDKILIKLDKKEIKLSSQEFNKHYLIRSSKSDLAKQLMTAKIQKAILESNLFSICYKTNTESQKAELMSMIQRSADDKDFIIALIKLHQDLIDRLSELKIII